MMINRLPNGLQRAIGSAFCLSLAACAASTAPAPDMLVVVDTVEVAARPNPELEQRAATLQLQVLERSAQVEDLQRQLDAARQEVVRAMARLQTLASRAEAASAMAEAEIGVEALSDNDAGDEVPAAVEARRLLALSTAEFAQDNYAGALYLASQARSLARASEVQLTSDAVGARHPGEVLFALPIPLVAATRSNIRSGPGLEHQVLATVEPGTLLVGRSHTEEWVRITDEEGRNGWIFQTLVAGGGDQQ